MTVLAMGFAPWLVLGAAAVIAWVLGHVGSDEPPADPDDPNAPDKDGFTPADKYGYGYDYSWGDPFGDPDL